MGSAVAPTVGGPDPYAVPDTGIWGPSGPGTQSSKAMLVGGRHARAMLQPQAWGTVQIRDTTWAHEWPVAGEGLVPRSDPAVRAVAEKGGVLADGARMRCVCVAGTRDAAGAGALLVAPAARRLWPDGAPPLSQEQLRSALLEEFTPIVGRGKYPVSGPAPDGKTMWEAMRGRGRHAELAARFALDQVKPLIEAPGGGSDPGVPASSSGDAFSHHREDHVRSLIEAERVTLTPASPSRFASHRAATDSVANLLIPGPGA